MTTRGARVLVFVWTVWALPQLSACAHLATRETETAGSLNISVQLLTGERQNVGSVEVRPAPRLALPSRVLSYDGSRTSTSVSVRQTVRDSVVFVLEEGPANPGQAIEVVAHPVGFPTDQDVGRFDVGGRIEEAQPPCVALSGFFIEGVGERPEAPVIVWFREGAQEASFSVDPRVHTLKLRPVLKFATDHVTILASRPSQYFVVLEASGTVRDYLLVGVIRRPDRAWWAAVFSSSRGRAVWSSPFQPMNEKWEWSLYAMEDEGTFRSDCRGVE